MDYAALATEWAIEDKTILDQTQIDPDQFTTAKTLYQYLCNLWTATTT
jgi:hypothetical protein